MKRRAILEYAVPEALTDYIETIDYPSNGGEMMRQVERIHDDHGNSGAYYATSLFAEHLGVSHLYIRLNNRIRVVNWNRGDNNEPRVVRDNQLDDDYRETLLMDLARKDLIIPYLEDYWLTEYRDDQDSIYYRAADRQRNGGAQTSPVNPQPEITQTELPPADTSVGAEVPASQPASEPEVTPTASTGSALERFANSGKGGLSNDPDEVEAIEELQTFLVELGLNVGNNGVDGRYGPRTIAAVRSFQESIAMLAQDGDAGPDTIAAIQEVKTDLARIEELVAALNELTDSAVPIAYKSGLAKLLERDLTTSERTELEQLLNKYQDFREAFPEYQTMAFSSAEAAISGEPLATAPEGPYTQGMVITAEVNDSLEAIGRERGMDGERLTPEDIEALNNAVANGDINPPSFASGAGDGAIAQNTATEPASDWEDITDGSAMIDGYSLFRKREAPRTYTFTVQGEQPNENSEEFNIPAMAIAAARRARGTDSQEVDATYTNNYTTNVGQFLRTSRTPDETRRFIEAIDVEGMDQRTASSMQGRIRQLIAILLGNARVPDNVRDIGGNILRNTPRETINLLRTFRDQTLVDVIANSPEDRPTTNATNNTDVRRDAVNAYNAAAAGEN